MKRTAKVFWKICVLLIALVLVALLAAGAWFGIRGYTLYQDAVAETPLSEKVEAIQQMDGYTQFEQLPEIYVDAVLSVEDKRFWSHPGVDVLAICRAAWNDLRTLSLAEGGSTITQQLMKNEYFTQEKTLERKFAEIFAALAMERAYSKEEIFELYVNTIYFGSGYYGIHDAAEGYYGQIPSALTDAEAVMLAGLPNAPSVYSPDVNPELARQRMVQVLNRMVKCNVLSQEQMDQILSAG